MFWLDWCSEGSSRQGLPNLVFCKDWVHNVRGSVLKATLRELSGFDYTSEGPMLMVFDLVN